MFPAKTRTWIVSCYSCAHWYLMNDIYFVTPVIYKGHSLMAKRWTEILEVSKKHANKDGIITENLKDFCQEPTGKIMLRTVTPEECDEIEEYARQHPNANYVAFKTQPSLLELQDPRVNKGEALLQICRNHNWTVDDIIAFGDVSNDNEMQKMAGLGVCLCNGLEDTKACADGLTDYDNEQDGMARWLVKNYPDLFGDFEYEMPAPEDGYFAPSEMPSLEEAQKMAMEHQKELEQKKKSAE